MDAYLRMVATNTRENKRTTLVFILEIQMFLSQLDKFGSLLGC